MKTWSRPLKMDYKEFVRETTKALTCDCINSLHFEYLVTPVDASNDVSFVWKKCMLQESVKVCAFCLLCLCPGIGVKFHSNVDVILWSF